MVGKRESVVCVPSIGRKYKNVRCFFFPPFLERGVLSKPLREGGRMGGWEEKIWWERGKMEVWGLCFLCAVCAVLNKIAFHVVK